MDGGRQRESETKQFGDAAPLRRRRLAKEFRDAAPLQRRRLAAARVAGLAQPIRLAASPAPATTLVRRRRRRRRRAASLRFQVVVPLRLPACRHCAPAAAAAPTEVGWVR